MNIPSNYPPGFNGGVESEDAVPHRCPNGHEWKAEMYFELGGWFYVDDDTGPFCSVCGAEGEIIKKG